MTSILAIDIGTQSLRAGIVDEALTIREIQRVQYAPKVVSNDRVEMDPEILWNALVTACRRLEQRDSIHSIVLSTLCPSLLPMDINGKPLYPIILHLDRRSYKQAQWALDKAGEDTFLNVTGNLPIPGGISVTSLLWLKEHEKEIYEKKDICFGHAVTFFTKRLTGQFVMDPSNASFTGLFQTVGYGDWDDRLLDALDIEKRKLPRTMLSNSIVGGLTREAAGFLGLKKGIPCVIGANDTTCAAVGAGAIHHGDIINTSGTVEIMVLCIDKPIVSKSHLLRTHAYPGKWLAMRVVGAGGASLEWFRKNLCREMNKDAFYKDYLKKVLSSSRSPESRFHPFLAGDRHCIKMKRASFTKLSLSTTRDDLLLSLVNGIIDFQAEMLDKWKRHTDLNQRIFHVGGGAQNAYTDYKQRKIRDFQFVQLGETTLTGAASLAIGSDK